MRSRPHCRNVVLLSAALLLGFNACRTWQPVALSAAGAPPAPVAAHVRLTRTNGRVDEVVGARIARDTLHGQFHHTARGVSPVAIAVPLDSVRSVEARRVSWWRTLGLGAGVFSLLALLDIMFSGYSGG